MADMQKWCGWTALQSGMSVHAVHGILRRTYKVQSVYRIPLQLWEMAKEQLASIANQCKAILLPAHRGNGTVPKRGKPVDARQRKLFGFDA